MTLSREEALVLHCVGLHLTDARAEVVKQTIAKDFRWDEFSRLTARHQIQPLWFRHLQQLRDIIPVPQDVITTLETAYRQTLCQNLFLIAELESLLQQFHCHHIKVILLKGAALLPTIYRDDWGVRVLGDIDLLVHEEDLLSTRDLLHRCEYGTLPFPTSEVDTLAEHLPPFIKEREGGPPVAIEVHARLGYPTGVTTYRSLPTERLWANTKVITINQTLALRPGDEDLLESLSLHLWAHIYGNPFTGLRRWCDIVALLQQTADTLDWECLFWNVRADHTRSYLVQSLYFITQHMGIPLPQQVPSRCRSLSTDSAFEQILTSLFSTAQPGQRHGRTQLAFFLTIPGVRQKVRYLLQLLFPNREFLQNRYRYLRFNVGPLYYVIRVGEALVRGIAAGVGLIRGRSPKANGLHT